MGFTDLVRGGFSRTDGTSVREVDGLNRSGGSHTQGGTPDSEDNEKAGEDQPVTTSRSMKGLTRIATATAKLPMEMLLATAQGLHNAPKLYGDRTVRQMPKVTGVRSGVKAAGKVRQQASQCQSHTDYVTGTCIGCIRWLLWHSHPTNARAEGGWVDRHVQGYRERHWRHLAEAVRW